MKGLILDTSSEQSFLLLADGASVIAFREIAGGPALSKSLGLLCRDFLASFSPEYVAVGLGPGSYTGIRVGAALAKGLAFGRGIPLLGFCSLEAFRPPTQEPFALLADAKMGGVYCLKGGPSGFEAPVRLSLSQAAELSLPLFSPHPENLRQKTPWKSPILRVSPDPVSTASFLSRKAPLSARSAREPLPFSYLDGKA